MHSSCCWWWSSVTNEFVGLLLEFRCQNYAFTSQTCTQAFTEDAFFTGNKEPWEECQLDWVRVKIISPINIRQRKTKRTPERRKTTSLRDRLRTEQQSTHIESLLFGNGNQLIVGRTYGKVHTSLPHPLQTVHQRVERQAGQRRTSFAAVEQLIVGGFQTAISIQCTERWKENRRTRLRRNEAEVSRGRLSLRNRRGEMFAVTGGKACTATGARHYFRARRSLMSHGMGLNTIGTTDKQLVFI